MQTILLSFAFAPGPFELVVILLVGLLLFGKRLPEIARNLGKGVVEFKRGLKNVEDEIEHAEYTPPPKKLYRDDETGSQAPANGPTTSSDG